uniref:TPM domain-containing protein n=1 Tax=Caulobacter sp. S45 TaxID=1641861 RepID=UPI0015771513
LVVVTLSSLQGDDIADYGYQLGRAWEIGQKGKNTGALFIVAPSEKKTRIEVGYGLEPVLTDAMSSVILNSQVLPRFRQGDVPGGVVAGTDAIIQQLGLDPATAQAQAQQAAAVQAQQEAQPQGRHHEVFGSIFSFLLFIFVISAFFRGGRRGGGLGWALPLMFLGGDGFGRDNDDGGGFSGGGGGGGFSGGGGSFGGGGASGGW